MRCVSLVVLVGDDSGLAGVIADAVGDQQDRVMVAIRKHPNCRDLSAIIDVSHVANGEARAGHNQRVQLDAGSAVLPQERRPTAYTAYPSVDDDLISRIDSEGCAA